MIMSELWVERHRPQSVDEIKGQASVVSRLTVYAEHKEFPHLLFAGPLNRENYGSHGIDQGRFWRTLSRQFALK